MIRHVLLDTGPLVASLRPHDNHHPWTTSIWKQVEPPFLTCEAVISEACYLLESVPGTKQAVMELLRREIITLPFHMSDETESVSALMKKYSDVPGSIADCCLVRMAELWDSSSVFTLDADFRIYRKHRRNVIPLIIPR